MSGDEMTVAELLELVTDMRRRAEGGGRTLVESSFDNVTLARLRQEFPQLKVVTSKHAPDGQVYVVDQDKIDKLLRDSSTFKFKLGDA